MSLKLKNPNFRSPFLSCAHALVSRSTFCFLLWLREKCFFRQMNWVLLFSKPSFPKTKFSKWLTFGFNILMADKLGFSDQIWFVIFYDIWSLSVALVARNGFFCGLGFTKPTKAFKFRVNGRGFAALWLRGSIAQASEVSCEQGAASGLLML